jgi:aspartate/methionine/tyrosine aminotransferase
LIDWIPPKGGTIAFLRYNLNLTSEELCLRLIEEKSLLLVPGTCFETEGFVRIGWGADTGTLIEGLSRFKQFLDSLRYVGET